MKWGGRCSKVDGDVYDGWSRCLQEERADENEAGRGREEEGAKRGRREGREHR